DYTGQSPTFKVRASDHGINSSDSPSIQVRIKADQEAPATQILTQGETPYDRPPVTLDFAIVHNVSVRSYQVRIIDHENRVVLEKTDLDQASVKVQDADVINLARYAPLAAEGTEFTLAVEATDRQGNRANLSRKVRVAPDAAPKVRIRSRVPQDNPVQGGLAHFQFEVADDYVA